MIRRFIGRAVCAIAVRVVSAPCAFWFGARVLVVVPRVGMFNLSRDDARYLASKLSDAANANLKL